MDRRTRLGFGSVEKFIALPLICHTLSEYMLFFHTKCYFFFLFGFLQLVHDEHLLSRVNGLKNLTFLVCVGTCSLTEFEGKRNFKKCYSQKLHLRGTPIFVTFYPTHVHLSIGPRIRWQ